MGVAVDGWQYSDGRVERSISLYDTDQELSAAGAREFAAKLIEAADALGQLSS